MRWVVKRLFTPRASHMWYYFPGSGSGRRRQTDRALPRCALALAAMFSPSALHFKRRVIREVSFSVSHRWLCAVPRWREVSRRTLRHIQLAHGCHRPWCHSPRENMNDCPTFEKTWSEKQALLPQSISRPYIKNWILKYEWTILQLGELFCPLEWF